MDGSPETLRNSPWSSTRVAKRLLSRSIGFAWAFALFSLWACDGRWSAHWLTRNQADIDESTQAIAAAPDDAVRAQGHSARGRAYSERARYSRSFKLISSDESGRLFDLAIQDHDRAVALAPGDARVYLDRGLTLYSRAALEDAADPKTRALFDSAKADFTAALERDGRNEQALDMRGLVHAQCGELDLAIDDFTLEMTINPKLGRLRLADAYCNRAAARQKENRTDLAISDYERAISIGVPADSCECQPDSPLAWLYFESKQYEKSWEVVHRAQESHRWIAPELVDQLKKASGRAAR